MKAIELDGKAGEGGGQLVRIAVALAALTTQAVKITNIRGKRERPGLKNQHVASIQWLAEATDAEVEGLRVGSKNLIFNPRKSPLDLVQRNLKITAASGSASALLIFQAVFPFLLYAGNSNNEPIELEISGGTNTSFSPSYEFLDQVLLPTLEERFGVQVERQLKRRGWSLGPQSRGHLWFKVQPLPAGQTLKFKAPARYGPASYRVKTVNVTMIVPAAAHEALQAAIVKDLSVLFPDAEVEFTLAKDSGFDSRWFVLLVAHSVDGIRWTKDALLSAPRKEKARRDFIPNVSNKLCKGLHQETVRRSHADEHLQDQLICFQALCEGFSSFHHGVSPGEEAAGEGLVDAMGRLSVERSQLRKEKNVEPFGLGTLHTQTMRWIVGEMLRVDFWEKGELVHGAGLSLSSGSPQAGGDAAAA